MKSFYTTLHQEARDEGISTAGLEPFAEIPYELELKIKKRATVRFFSEAVRASSVTTGIVPAVKPREYRSTSRRRIYHDRRRISLVHGDGTPASNMSPLELKGHGKVYKSIQNTLERMDPEVREVFNHIIVRGTYSEFALILTVDRLDARVVRACRSVAANAQKDVKELKHGWVYVDPKRSRYYLELERPVAGVGTKKMFGAAAWKQAVNKIDYQVGVFSFSQINYAMLPNFVDAVCTEAAVTPEDMLIDLYCGYGLFGAALARDVQSVIAVDQDLAGVNNARYNVARAGGKVFAMRTGIEAGKIKKLYDACKQNKQRVLIIDPPRTGTPKGLIDELSVLEPRRVVTAFCGSEEIGRSIKEWKVNGYQLEKVIPLDFFPGTTSIEVIASFVKI